jgi:hypothetical protein
VAVPEIGQNLHELDWQFLPFRFSIYSVGAPSGRLTQPSFSSGEPSVLSLSGGPTLVSRRQRDDG